MRKLEEQTRKNVRRAKIQQAVALALYGATAVGIATFMPQAIAILKDIDPDLEKKRNPSYRIKQALARLVKLGLVTHTTKNGGSIRLTESGKRYIDRLRLLEQASMQKPRAWDGRWRVVVFDVWERRRVVRDQLRTLLQKIGFVRLQNSVWVYPYDCEEVLMLVRTDLNLGKGVLYIVAEGIENDTSLRDHFRLPK